MFYYIYRAQAKIEQLYQQLPKSRVAAQKRISHTTQRNNAEIHHKMKQEHTQFRHHETQLHTHDIARLEQVLRALRQDGQLHKGTPQQAGRFYEISGEFSSQEHLPCPSSEEEGYSPAPDGYVWLAGDELRLLCKREDFASAAELFANGQTLPLHGVVLWVGYGLPVCLWME